MGRFAAFRDSFLTVLALLGILISGPLSNLKGIQALFLLTSAIGIIVPLLMYKFSDVKELDQIMLNKELTTSDQEEIVTMKNGFTEEIDS